MDARHDGVADEWRGRSAKKTFRLSAALVDGFVALSQDSSPLHLSDDAARALGFQGRVVHGLLLASLVSGLVGTALPGERGILQNVDLAFRNPCYLDDEVTAQVWVADFIESVRTLILKVRVERQDGTVLVTGTFRSGLRERA